MTKARLAALVIAAAAAAPVVLALASLARLSLAGDAALWPHLINFVLPVASVQTALLLVGVAVSTAITGVGTAWLVTTFEFPGRRMFLWLLPLPLAIPTYIAAYIYADLLDAAGPVQTALRRITGLPTDGLWFPPVRSLGGAILIFGLVLYPYVYLAARAMFQTQCAVFADAARSMGARPWRLACDITLPLARPAVAVGVSLALLETLNDIGASEYLGVQTMTLSIFTTWLNRNSLPGAAQIALTMMVLVVALIALERYGRQRQSYQIAAQDSRLATRVPLTGGRGALAAALCLAPVAFGFIVPALFLLLEVLSRGLLASVTHDLVRPAAATVMLAAAATALLILLAAAITVPLRQKGLPFARGAIAVASMGYAVPGTVLALGLMSPLVFVDEIVNWLSVMATGRQVGLLLAGSSAAVVIALSVRFAAIAIGFVQAGLSRVAGDFDDAARSLGAGPLAVLRTVHLPLLRPALAGAALLIFVDCLKELPMTLLLRPLNVETLATYIYQFATRGSFEDGALAALLIVAAGIVPIVYLVRLAERDPAAARMTTR